MNPSLQGYAAAVIDGGPGAGQLAEELAAVERAVLENPTLFTALTDTAVPAAARRGVVGDLLRGRVGEPARRTAAYAVGVVHAPEVPAALGWLSHRARQRAADEVVSDPALGHLAARTRVGGFAAAMFEDLSTAELEEVEDQLFRFARTVADTPSLRTALSNGELPADVRCGVARQLIEGKVLPATLRLVEYTLVGGRSRDVVGTLDWLVERTAEARGWRVARVRAAQAVGDTERERLAQTLSSIAGHPVELQVTVDPELLAGVVVEVGDLRLDATARGRLDRLREHMAVGGFREGALR